MNDLYFVKYQPKLMLTDTIDMPADVELAHRRLTDFIWAMDKAPKLDHDMLCHITKTSAMNWARVLAELKEKGWHERSGYLIHDAVIRTLNEAKGEWAAMTNRMAKTRGEPKPLAEPTTDGATGIVTYVVTKDVRPLSQRHNHNHNNNHNIQSEEHTPSEGELLGPAAKAFEAIEAAYPKKGREGEAGREFMRQWDGDDRPITADILANIAGKKASGEWDDPRYIPNLLRFIHERLWRNPPSVDKNKPKPTDYSKGF